MLSMSAAAGVEAQLRFADLIGLEDAVRDDSCALVKAINDAGGSLLSVTRRCGEEKRMQVEGGHREQHSAATRNFVQSFPFRRHGQGPDK
jgi:hypothetical protein